VYGYRPHIPTWSFQTNDIFVICEMSIKPSNQFEAIFFLPMSRPHVRYIVYDGLIKPDRTDKLERVYVA